MLRLQEVFAEDWHFATGEDLATPRFFAPQNAAGDELVRVVASGPDQRWEVLHHILFTAITGAERSVLLTTPYFIPDRSMEVALLSAALRGVDVRLLIPRRSDSRLLDLTAGSFLPDLLRAGVRVFRYGPGMMHAKSAVIDGQWSTVGSANMDIRSFRLNFEVGALVMGRGFARRMEQRFEADAARSIEITAESLRAQGYWARLRDGFARLLSPLL